MINKERAIVRILREISVECGVAYKSYAYDWMIKLTKNGESRIIFGYNFPQNPATSAAVCTDKAAASALLADCGVPCVAHRFFIRPSEFKYIGVDGNWVELIGMLEREGELVCKPNEGTGGGQVFRAGTVAALENAVTQIFSSHRSMAACKYHNIRSEHRVILLDGAALVAYEKKLPYVTGDGRSSIAALTAQKYPGYKDHLSGAGDIPARGETAVVGWMHNLNRGASPELLDLSDPLAKRLEKLASDAASACGVRFASVDIINAAAQPESEMMVLEINSGVMMEAFASVSNEFYNIAKNAYKNAVLKMW